VTVITCVFTILYFFLSWPLYDHTTSAHVIELQCTEEIPVELMKAEGTFGDPQVVTFYVDFVDLWGIQYSTYL
jgi:hypothetical protein